MGVQAQNQQTIESVDSITYIQFFNQDYSSLQKTVKNAIDAGIDFYYLRTRLAISYYNQKNFESALPHFQNAQEIFPIDTIIQEYFYYTLLFTGREEDAYDLAQNFSESMQYKIGFKKRRFFRKNEIVLAFGLANNNNISKYKTLDIKGTHNFAEGTFQGLSKFTSIAVKTNLFPRFNLTTGLSYYENKSMGKIQTFDSTAIKTFWNNPYQFNVALDYLFPSGFKIGGTYGTYYESSNFYSAEFDSSLHIPIYRDNQKVNKPYTASIFSTYRWNRFELFVSGSMGNLAYRKQKQGELGLVFYPFGNQNFYTVTSGTILKNNSMSSFIIHQKVGIKATKSLWCELSASYGNLQNYIGAGGFLTYNTFDRALFLSYLRLRFFVSHFEITPSYGLQIRENNYYIGNNLFNLNTITNKYLHHTLTVTIKWNF